MNTPSNASRQRRAVAAVAARLIAEDGLDYTAAKAKAAQQVIGLGTPKPDALPEDDEVEEALREYQRLFQSDTQPVRLAHLRRVALSAMQLLPQYELFLVGAVANGTAGEHDAVYLQSYVESSKDLHIDLLNAGIDADADEVPNPFGRGRVERLTFWHEGETVHITCYPPNRARQIGDQLAERLARFDVESLVRAQRGSVRRGLLFGLIGLSALGGGIALGVKSTLGPAATPQSTPSGDARSAPLFAASLNDLQGKPQALAQWRGRLLLVNFWATWCAPCVEELPQLQAIHQAYIPKGLQVIGVAIDNPKAVAEFQKKVSVNYPILLGGADGTDLARHLGDASAGLPFTVVIDTAGALVYSKLGRFKDAELRTKLDALIAATATRPA